MLPFLQRQHSSRYQNVSILDLFVAKDDGGGGDGGKTGAVRRAKLQ